MTLIILDFGSQYTPLIARRVRELGAYCEILPYTLSEAEFRQKNPTGVILSGGPDTATQETAIQAPDWLFSINCPLLGICYGMQIMAKQLGGVVQPATIHEYGYAKVDLAPFPHLLTNLSAMLTATTLEVWMSHGDQVTTLPPDFQVICQTPSAPIAGMQHTSKPWFGLQFHPEVTQTKAGTLILKRFVQEICKTELCWTPPQIATNLIQQVTALVGQERVLVAVSGGVDSSVLAALLHQAIGSQLICVFVDTGLLRLNEAAEVKALFAAQQISLISIEAESCFLNALQGITDPEEKRKIIGRTFIEIFEQKAAEFPDVQWLAQGTIYSDRIESAATTPETAAQLIKSHHNVGGLPETLKLKLLEPLRDLFKDEVRTLGLALGLSPSTVLRHPFPGPGLGVRILGEVKKAYADILRQADAIFMEALRTWDLYDKVGQAFAVFLPIKTVGVVGDCRRYAHVICLRAVETTDFMTAAWAQLPHDFLSAVSNQIINEVPHISRVVYDISGKPPATIEWE